MSHDLRDDLLSQNEEYRRLEQQHHDYDSRLKSYELLAGVLELKG